MKLKHVTAAMFDRAGTTVDHVSRAPAIVFPQIFRLTGIEITSAQARGPIGIAKRDHIAAIREMREAALARRCSLIAASPIHSVSGCDEAAARLAV